LLKKKVFVYLRPVLQVVLYNIKHRKGFKQCPDRKEHISRQRGKEKINMGLESAWLPLMEEKF